MTSTRQSKKCISMDDVSASNSIMELKQIAKKLGIHVTRKEGTKYKSLSKDQLFNEIQKAVKGGKGYETGAIIPSHRKSKLIVEAKALGIKVTKGMSGSQIQEILDIHDDGNFFFDTSKPKKYYENNYHILYTLAKTAHLGDAKPKPSSSMREGKHGEKFTVKYDPPSIGKVGNADELLSLFDKRYLRNVNELPVKIIKLVARLRGIPLSGKNKPGFSSEFSKAKYLDEDLETIIKDAHIEDSLSEYKKNLEKNLVYANEVILAVAPPRGRKLLKRRVARKDETKKPKRSFARKPKKEEDVVSTETIETIKTPSETIKRTTTCEKKPNRVSLECKEKEEIVEADEEKPKSKRSFSRRSSVMSRTSSPISL